MFAFGMGIGDWRSGSRYAADRVETLGVFASATMNLELVNDIKKLIFVVDEQ